MSQFQPARLRGSLLPPGDKSISHRAAIFGALAGGHTEVRNFLEAEDTLHTLAAFGPFGVTHRKQGAGHYTIESPGLLPGAGSATTGDSPDEEITAVECGNSGTAMRLLTGLFAGLPGCRVKLTGDASLSKRPMGRVADPLATMGAQIETTSGRPPLLVRGRKLTGTSYRSAIASAQVKSALILAAMASGVELEYSEPLLSRDHTENFIRQFNQLEYLNPHKTHFRLTPPYRLEPGDWQVPGDISAAAFFLVAGVCAGPDSEIKLRQTGLNPTRSGILQYLPPDGLTIEPGPPLMGEPTGDLIVGPARPDSVHIQPADIPSLIDEIPILTILGLFAREGFSVRGASELRVKESDRIGLMATNLRRLGLEVEEWEDGYRFAAPLTSPEKTANWRAAAIGKKIETGHDHRIVMSFAILDHLLNLDLQIEGREWINTSYPRFFQDLRGLATGATA